MAGPFFIPDLSSWEGNRPNFEAIAAAGPSYVGCIIKSSEGVGPGVRVDLGHSPTWFRDNWQRLREAGGARYGKTWFRGCFHFGHPTPSGTAQADYMLATVERAGGWGEGDLPPAWDLEGKLWTSRQQIVDVSSQFSERIKQKLGKSPLLYTGSTWRQFAVADRAGFNVLWTTHLDLMAKFGWPNTSILLHQYVGDGKYYNPSGIPAKSGYPTGIPGMTNPVDMNVILEGGVPVTSIERVREIFTGRSGLFAAESRGGISLPVIIGVGAGILTLGILAATAGRDELV